MDVIKLSIGKKSSRASELALLLLHQKHEKMPRLACRGNVRNTWRTAVITMLTILYPPAPQSLQLTRDRCLRVPLRSVKPNPDQLKKKCLANYRLGRQKIGSFKSFLQHNKFPRKFWVAKWLSWNADNVMFYSEFFVIMYFFGKRTETASFTITFS